MEDIKTDPVWISVKDTQHYFSIGKTTCYELIKDNKIESKLLKNKGAKQGKRLINYDSVNTFITELSN